MFKRLTSLYKNNSPLSKRQMSTQPTATIYQWASKDTGEFNRQTSSFRSSISSDPSSRYQPAANRYHLYISLACPWAHRALIVRNLKGLEDVIGLSVVHYEMGPQGWHFEEGMREFS